MGYHKLILLFAQLTGKFFEFDYSHFVSSGYFYLGLNPFTPTIQMNSSYWARTRANFENRIILMIIFYVKTYSTSLIKFLAKLNVINLIKFVNIIDSKNFFAYFNNCISIEFEPLVLILFIHWNPEPVLQIHCKLWKIYFCLIINPITRLPILSLCLKEYS